jgi:hypothetical protein
LTSPILQSLLKSVNLRKKKEQIQEAISVGTSRYRTISIVSNFVIVLR